MFVHHRTRGVVIKKVDRGEADQLFTIYTESFGKIEVLGKAIRKISSKLRAGMDVLYLSEIEFIQGKYHRILTDAVLIDNFQNLRENLPGFNSAVRISRMLDILIREQEAEERIWELLIGVLNGLNKRSLSLEKSRLVQYYFFWHLVSLLGYRPEIFNCSECQRKLRPNKIYFSSSNGGVLCKSCFTELKKGEEIAPSTVKILRLILSREKDTLPRVKIKREHFVGLEKVTSNYFSFIVEKGA
jgi:DNA repair protein RecO (recombination protein O)